MKWITREYVNIVPSLVIPLKNSDNTGPLLGNEDCNLKKRKFLIYRNESELMNVKMIMGRNLYV